MKILYLLVALVMLACLQGCVAVVDDSYPVGRIYIPHPAPVIIYRPYYGPYFHHYPHGGYHRR